MAHLLPKSVRTLIDELAKLPSIGPKSAQRLAMYLLRQPDSRLGPLGDAILDLKKNVQFCKHCWNLAEAEQCDICECSLSGERDGEMICVVEDVLDVVALEKTGQYKGVYHVLHGVLSPVEGVGPDQLKIQALFDRMHGGVREVILATNPSLEGEATALYIQRQLMATEGVRVTRIARGLPVGGDVEYADSITLSRALNGRGEF